MEPEFWGQKNNKHYSQTQLISSGNTDIFSTVDLKLGF